MALQDMESKERKQCSVAHAQAGCAFRHGLQFLGKDLFVKRIYAFGR